MNRDALLVPLPSEQAWNAFTPAQRKDAVERLIESILNAVVGELREPDDWEATDMGAALNAIQMGWYNAAITYGMYALAPPHERAREWPRVATTPTATQLRHALDYVKGMPVRAE